MDKAGYLRDTVDIVGQIETRFLELGARLYKIRREALWQAGYDTYQDFLDAAKISQGNASILAKIHYEYVIRSGAEQTNLIGAGYSNLYEAIPLIERDGVDATITKAKLLTRSELKEEVREEKHGVCGHPEKITICAVCHKRL